MTGRSAKRGAQRASNSSNSGVVPTSNNEPTGAATAAISHHSDMSKSKFQPPVNRRGLRRRAGGLASGDLSLPGGLRLPASIARRRPFSWLLKMMSSTSHGFERNSSSSSNTVGNNGNSPSSSSRGGLSSFHYVVILSTLVALVLMGLHQYQNYQRRHLVSTPIENVPLMFSAISENGHSQATSASLLTDLFWGTYRPQLYFGIRHRSPHSLLGGLMWFRQGHIPPQIRHWCDSGQNLIYNWIQHDGRSFATQDIQDQGFSLTTSFLKRPRESFGGDWTSRIHIKPSKASSPTSTGSQNMPIVSIMFYFMLPNNQRGQLTPIIQNKELIGIQGYTVELGNFHIYFQRGANFDGSLVKHVSYLVTRASREDQIQESISRGMGISKGGQRRVGLVGHDKDLPDNLVNLVVYEMSVSGEYALDIVFHSGESIQNAPDVQGLLLTGNQFDHLLQEKVNDFNRRFHDKFPLKSLNYSEAQVSHGQSILANLIGGIGFFHGESLIRAQDVLQTDEPVLYGPGSLFTATPSRPQFPRGFLWDEGFHQLLISRWDSEMSLEIIAHWLQLMNGEGWIPREQILGWEARAKVPKEFIVQDHRNGNPPTLILPLLALMDSLDVKDKSQWFIRHAEFLHRALPRLEAWYQWFNSTQLGESSTAYRWHGRNANAINQLNPLTLTSGLDDYPRASHPTDNERHLDLRCWMTMFSRLMSEITGALYGETNANHLRYANWANILSNEDLLTQLHWNEEGQHFSDFGLHTESVYLVRPAPKPGSPDEIPAKERIVKVPPKLQFIPQKGYVTLFPLLSRILSPNSAKLGIILQNLKNETEMWTNYGLRSLARSASLYQRHNTEHDPPYWRGAIWMNMNYLAVRALRYYSLVQGPHSKVASDLYHSLRDNLVKNVLKELQETGFLWEQYDDTTGKGQRAHPFVGWSSLILLIMAEE